MSPPADSKQREANGRQRAEAEAEADKKRRRNESLMRWRTGGNAGAMKATWAMSLQVVTDARTAQTIREELAWRLGNRSDSHISHFACVWYGEAGITSASLI